MPGCVYYIFALRHFCHQWCGGSVTIWYHVAVITLSTENFVTWQFIAETWFSRQKSAIIQFLRKKWTRMILGTKIQNMIFLILWMVPVRSETMIIFGPWPRGENCFSFFKGLENIVKKLWVSQTEQIWRSIERLDGI